MIHLHHPDGRSVYLNPDLIERFEVEESTIVVLVDGERVRVRETPDEATAAMRDYRAEVILAVDRHPSRRPPSAGGSLRLVPSESPTGHDG